MIGIGEFARLVGVSVRMLRHYDQLGLLVPERVDSFTGYRFYSSDQLDRANRLVALKDLGFSLDEVGQLLNEASSSRLTEMLSAREAELRRQISQDHYRLSRVQANLRLVEQESHMSTTYTEGPLPALSLVQLAARVTEMSEIESEIGPMFDRVNKAIEAAGVERVGPGVAHYTSEGDTLVAAAGEQIGGAVTPEGLDHASLEAVPRALTNQYVGPDVAGIPGAWQELVAEIERRGLQMRGTCREVYLQTPFENEGTKWVVDLQQPVA